MKPNYILIPLFTILVASLGSYLTGTGLEIWYRTINLPTWTPSGAVISIVWTTIFVLAAVSALIVWNKTQHDKRFWWTIAIFILNGIFNTFWSFLFFSQHLISAAVFEAVLLGLSIITLIVHRFNLESLPTRRLTPPSIPPLGLIRYVSQLQRLDIKLKEYENSN